MTKLIVLSDSHNTGYKRMVNILEKENNYNAVFFLGDGEYDADRLSEYLGSTPFYRVRGNCDYASELPLDGVVPIGGQLFLYTHGHKQGVKTGMGGLFLEGMRSGAKIIMFGHTHVAYNKTYDEFRFFNPGSVSYPRGGPASYGRITLPDDNTEEINFEIVEINT